MATQGKRLDDSVKNEIERRKRAGLSVRKIAREAGVSKSTAQKYLKAR